MKRRSISIILSLLLVAQPALPIFEGAKRKVVDKPVAWTKKKIDEAKRAILRAKALLRDNMRCIISGTGKGCDAGTRSGLQILKDLVSGNLAKIKAAKQKAKEFIKNNWACMKLGPYDPSREAIREEKMKQIPGCIEGKATVLLVMITLLALFGPPLALLGPALGFVKAESLREEEYFFRDLMRQIWEDVPKNYKFIYKVIDKIIPRILSHQNEKSWNSIRHNGETLISLVLRDSSLSEQKKKDLIQLLKEKGVVPTRDEQGRISILIEGTKSPIYEAL